MTDVAKRMIDVESLARSLHFDWIDQHGYPNGLQTWDELPDRSPTKHAADMHCKATWRSFAESVHATIRALQEENERLREALKPMADAWHKLQTDGAQHLNADPEKPSHGMGTIRQKHTKQAALLLGIKPVSEGDPS